MIMDYQPVYRDLLTAGILKKRVQEMNKKLARCDLCPRNCSVNRLGGELGICGVGQQAWVSSYGPHLGEEKPLRGRNGSGTIFFSGCNLACIYCQNADISQQLAGRPVTAEQLAEIMLELQARGCHNINLVSPTHVISQILEAIYLAAEKGLSLPIVYNTGGYDSIGTLELLDGIIDIYMPDMKYSSDNSGERLSGVPDYPSVNKKAVREMHRQVGDLRLDYGGIAVKGLLIRHLVLPAGLAGSRNVLDFIAREISRNTYLNIMDQYRPAYKAQRLPEIDRLVHQEEFEAVIDLAAELGLKRLDDRFI
jgi:putative pyruvate formate lyase activating enzyme